MNLAVTLLQTVHWLLTWARRHLTLLKFVKTITKKLVRRCQQVAYLHLVYLIMYSFGQRILVIVTIVQEADVLHHNQIKYKGTKGRQLLPAFYGMEM